ncbi:type VI secretion system protein TssL, long form [Xanthobacter oligotrophicus]|uniref:type VI secretion system protein TssL, long form n=1 Tax=Xanthobacter oligotrophicus TaxID=2607286 RepID=UPI0011F3BAC5|nr:type VI secretion system protein TssL, long form [Xanthobacter oligotrophicus]MCG5233950.1 type VI secretion system protein TssL, long form [Xanthobacter oligotrophicus]
MSDDPFDDRQDRTVFRPNPGGRRPTTPQPPYPAPAGGPGTGPAPTAPQVAAPLSPNPRDTWGVPGGDAAPASAFPRPALLERAQMTLPHQNQIMRAAGPLLLLLGRLRIALMRASFAELMQHAADTITAFDAEVRRAGLPEPQVNAAKYILCATADDIVQHIPNEDQHVWAQYSMLSRFFGERIGGVRFFQELEKAIADPTHNGDLLELLHVSLALGFQGMHRTTPNGQATLQGLQRRTYEVMKSVRARTPEELSPRWVGLDIRSRQGQARVPFWVVGALVAAGLAALYLTYWSLLSGDAEVAAHEMTGLHPPVEMALYRRVPTPPPPPPPPFPPPSPSRQPTQLERIRAQMAPEIAAGEVSADAVGSRIVIRVANGLLFDSGKAQVRPQFAAVAAKLAGMLEKEPGPIRIVGHTDDEPVSSGRFKSNFELSVARARAVAGDLKPHLSDPGRLVSEGRGEDEPVAPNTTSQNMARNRRVEIWIDRAD